MSDFEICVDRNLRGKELEESGQIQEAIRLYEMNVAENFEGSHPYYRLSEIYHKQKLYDEEIRVLEHAIYVFDNIVYRNRSDRKTKLSKFKDKLKKARKSLENQSNV